MADPPFMETGLRTTALLEIRMESSVTTSVFFEGEFFFLTSLILGAGFKKSNAFLQGMIERQLY